MAKNGKASKTSKSQKFEVLREASKIDPSAAALAQVGNIVRSLEANQDGASWEVTVEIGSMFRTSPDDSEQSPGGIQSREIDSAIDHALRERGYKYGYRPERGDMIIEGRFYAVEMLRELGIGEQGPSRLVEQAERHNREEEMRRRQHKLENLQKLDDLRERCKREIEIRRREEEEGANGDVDDDDENVEKGDEEDGESEDELKQVVTQSRLDAGRRMQYPTQQRRLKYKRHSNSEERDTQSIRGAETEAMSQKVDDEISEDGRDCF